MTSVKMVGGSVHHDNGVLGAAAQPISQVHLRQTSFPAGSTKLAKKDPVLLRRDAFIHGLARQASHDKPRTTSLARAVARAVRRFRLSDPLTANLSSRKVGLL